MFEIRPICHAQDFWKLNLGFVNGYVHIAGTNSFASVGSSFTQCRVE